MADSEGVPPAIRKRITRAVQELELVVDHAMELGADTVHIYSTNGMEVAAQAREGFRLTTPKRPSTLCCAFSNSEDVDDGGFDLVPEESPADPEGG